ncbi:hypothetical protein [Streptomyces sp. 5-6(2022)]|nr:hypothetical protein [Streptomyces sp. 5-6(2022)]
MFLAEFKVAQCLLELLDEVGGIDHGSDTVVTDKGSNFPEHLQRAVRDFM